MTPFGDIDLERARRYAELGVDRLILLFPVRSPRTLFELNATTGEILDYVKRIGDSVIGKL